MIFSMFLSHSDRDMDATERGVRQDTRSLHSAGAPEMEENKNATLSDPP